MLVRGKRITNFMNPQTSTSVAYISTAQKQKEILIMYSGKQYIGWSGSNIEDTHYTQQLTYNLEHTLITDNVTRLFN
jgi:hypothetical protein